MHSFAHGETIVIVHRVPKLVAGVKQFDSFGNLIYDEVRVTVSGAVVWPQANTETPQNVERSSTTYYVALPDDSLAVLPVDRIEWRSHSYEVQGEMEQNTNMATGTKANTFAMKRVQG